MTSAQADQWRRARPTAQQRRADSYVGLTVAALSLVNLTLANSTGALAFGRPPSWPEQVCWTLAVTLPLAWRRRWPEATIVIIAVVFIAAQARSHPEQQFASGALFAAIYTLGAWGRRRRLAWRLRVGVIVAMFGWLALGTWLKMDQWPADAFAGASGPIPPVLAAIIAGVLNNALFFGAAFFAGEVASTAARRQDQLRDQAEELRRSQAQAGERAVMRERVRIARELHDVVAHHVSVMGVQASASRRVMDRDPAKARAALAAIEQSARSAVDELRRMLGVLRDSGDDQRVDADLDQVERLLAGARDAGLTVEFGVFGPPATLPSSLSLAAYRVVQEAVTNTLKHAGATLIDVRIRYLASELEIDVSDNGRGAGSGSNSGYGLIGMRERVAAHDGTLEVGPRDRGGFRVRARFPLTAGTATAAAAAAAAA